MNANYSGVEFSTYICWYGPCPAVLLELGEQGQGAGYVVSCPQLYIYQGANY